MPGQRPGSLQSFNHSLRCACAFKLIPKCVLQHTFLDSHRLALTARLLTQVLVVSPLTRAIQTTALAWPHYDGPVEVEALARERVWLSSDCGRSPAELKAEFPDGR